MSKLIKSSILCSLILLFMVGFSIKSDAKQSITLKVNGWNEQLGSEPFIEKGYVYIPLRNVSELLGYKVDWDVSKRAATIIGINNKLVLNSSSNLAIKNGKSMKMNPSMKMINNKIYVPLRFISEMMGDQVQWEQKSKTISVTSKYILVKAKYKNSEYWVNKINGDLYFVVGSNLPKKIGQTDLKVPIKTQRDYRVSLEAKQTPKGNVLLNLDNNHGEPGLSTDRYSIYLKDNKIIKKTKVFYYNRWMENISTVQNKVVMTDGKKLYVYDDQTTKLITEYDLVALGGEDENYFIEGMGQDYLLIRPNLKGVLMLVKPNTKEKVELYKEIFKNDPEKLEYFEENDTPYRGDDLKFIEEKNGVLYFKTSVFNEKTVQYKL